VKQFLARRSRLVGCFYLPTTKKKREKKIKDKTPRWLVTVFFLFGRPFVSLTFVDHHRTVAHTNQMALFVGLYLAMKLPCFFMDRLWAWIETRWIELEDGWRVNVVQILVLCRTVLS
jgi:hypothetical protein